MCLVVITGAPPGRGRGDSRLSRPPAEPAGRFRGLAAIFPTFCLQRVHSKRNRGFSTTKLGQHLIPEKPPLRCKLAQSGITTGENRGFWTSEWQNSQNPTKITVFAKIVENPNPKIGKSSIPNLKTGILWFLDPGAGKTAKIRPKSRFLQN